MINVRKRGNFYQYQFEVAPVDERRKQVTKSGFKTKAEAVTLLSEFVSKARKFSAKVNSYNDYIRELEIKVELV